MSVTLLTIAVKLQDLGFKRPGNELDEVLHNALDELETLRCFKAYVHQRLDEVGIPTHPNGEHSAHGCRIGDRLDIALSTRALVAALDAAFEHMRICRACSEADLGTDCFEGGELRAALAKARATK